jgi:conjugative transfer signal peptidase TraF
MRELARLLMKIRKTCFLFGLCFLCFFFWAYWAGYRINNSPSVPTGIWKIDPLPGTAWKDDYVVVPPEAQPAYEFAVERGYVSAGTPLLKKIAAAAGDVIDYNLEIEYITVNGEILPYTAISSADSAGRLLYSAKFPVCLKKGEVWLSSENIRGYDSRYFGPVSADLIVRAVPVFLF